MSDFGYYGHKITCGVEIVQYGENLPYFPSVCLCFCSPHLTWRDVQHIIVETSQKTSAFDEGWKTNGAGKQFNHKFGFGKMDAMKMVDAALKWKLVPKQRVCHDTKYDTKR